MAKILGFSFFCDWQDIANTENGGIDVDRLIEEDKARGSEKKSQKAAAAETYYETILRNEFDNEQDE